jgi:membrane-bound lytic murein transglycosylase D
MKLGLLLALLLTTAFGTHAQEAELDVKGLLDTAEQWAQENLDEDVLAALPEVDRSQVEKFLREFQTQLQSEYVLDLAALNGAAKAVLPLLDAHEETKPYAAWLRSRLDYFEVAEEFRKTMPAPKLVPGEPPKPTPNPSPDAERKSWQKKLSQRDWPKGAKELVPTLKPIFANAQVPQELIWVAEVESGFNPKACSPVGAAGLFQLMPATAKRFGLRTSWLRDQRYQPEPSTKAAAQYLKQLHKEFGDWRLALAAYNAGEGTVQKLLDRHKARSFDGIATHLPAETQMFVPKVEATVWRREGVQLAGLKVQDEKEKIPKYPNTQTPKH